MSDTLNALVPYLTQAVLSNHEKYRALKGNPTRLPDIVNTWNKVKENQWTPTDIQEAVDYLHGQDSAWCILPNGVVEHPMLFEWYAKRTHEDDLRREEEAGRMAMNNYCKVPRKNLKQLKKLLSKHEPPYKFKVHNDIDPHSSTRAITICAMQLSEKISALLR
jgi:hypothetical protein